MRTPWSLLFACLLVAAGCSDGTHPTAVQTGSLTQTESLTETQPESPQPTAPLAAVEAPVAETLPVTSYGVVWPLPPEEYVYDSAAGTDIVALPEMDVHEFWEQQIITNCYLVQAAVEAWAATNDGVYPNHTGARNPLGRTLFYFLPGGGVLRNPITLACDSPIDGAACVSGMVGYRRLDLNGDGIADGYIIDSLTKHHEPLLVLTKP